MKRTRTVTMISFGLAGHGETIAPALGLSHGSHLSGYDRPDNWTPMDGADYTGAIVIDKRGPLERDPGLAYDSPIPRHDLAAGHIARYLGPIEAAPLHTARGMDCVPPCDLARWWHQRGARLGRVIGGQIQWLDTTRNNEAAHINQTTI